MTECGVKYRYNNGSAYAMHGRPNTADRCRLEKGHVGAHGQPAPAQASGRYGDFEADLRNIAAGTGDPKAVAFAERVIAAAPAPQRQEEETMEWVCPKKCGHSAEDHTCHRTTCPRGCHGHDGSDGPCDCPEKYAMAQRPEEAQRQEDQDELRLPPSPAEVAALRAALSASEARGRRWEQMYREACEQGRATTASLEAQLVAAEAREKEARDSAREQEADADSYYSSMKDMEVDLRVARTKLVAAEAQATTLREALRGLDEALGVMFWTSDDGEKMRRGTPEDEDAPPKLAEAWKAARVLLEPLPEGASQEGEEQ